MTAYINTDITLKGNKEEILKVINYLKNNNYLSSYTINKKFIDNLNNDELLLLINENNTTIKMSGPYGKYNKLYDAKIFEEVSNIVPNIYFYGISKGAQGGVKTELIGELKDKKLRLVYQDANDYGYDVYMNYLSKVFPKEKFCKLFKINIDDLDDDDYEDFFTSEYLDSISYDDFLDYFDYSEIDEDDFDEAQSKFEELNIYDYDSYENIVAEEGAKECIYDPVSKEYTKWN